MSSPSTPSDRPIRLCLDMPSEVRAAETVPMRLRARNDSGRPLLLQFGPYPEFIVTTRSGKEIWSSHHNVGIPAVLGGKLLNPGDELRWEERVRVRDKGESRIERYYPFEVKWKQVGNDGRPVPPGTYLVRAVLEVEWPLHNGTVSGMVNLETEPAQLIIRR